MHLQDFPVIAKGIMSVLHRSFHQSFYNKLKKLKEAKWIRISKWINKL